MPGEGIIMASNLPLLFVFGRPRSLESLQLDELEGFTNFMILCSLKVEIKNKPNDLNTLPIPEWWPEDVPFRFPLCRHLSPDKKRVALKKLVCRCYTFYNCEYYLKFSAELSERPISDLKFRQNPEEKTTSILSSEGNILVKCRNENFSYDKRNTRRSQVIQTPQQPTSSPPRITRVRQPKRPTRITRIRLPKRPPLIDLTSESSGDEAEVCFKAPFPVKNRKFKQSSSAVTNSVSQTLSKADSQSQIPSKADSNSQTPAKADIHSQASAKSNQLPLAQFKQSSSAVTDSLIQTLSKADSPSQIPSNADSNSQTPSKADTHSQALAKTNQLPQADAGTSKSTCSSSSSAVKKLAKKKMLFENFRKLETQLKTQNEEPTPEKVSRKRKRNVLLPTTRKTRRFEDFSSEEPEPELFSKEEFMTRIGLAPQHQEPVKLDYKIEGKRKLSQSFTLLTLTSQRGQALLARNDRFNMAASLDRNSRYCGTHHQEEEEVNQMCTRSNDPSQFFKNKDLIIPSKRTAIIKNGYTHSYKWPRRTKNVVYPPRGISLKECSVQIRLLSKRMINSWLVKKLQKATMTPEEWRDKNSTICACQKIPLIVLDDESTSTFKNKSSSTRCMCVGSQTQSTPQTKSQEIENNDSFNKEMVSSQRTVIGNHRHVAEKLSCKNKTFTNTCDSAKQMKVSYLDEKEAFRGFPVIHSEPFLSSKRVLHRRPLAVVPSEPITLNEELAVSTSVTYLPDNISTAPSIKHNNLFRSLSDAIKWYTKDEPTEVSDRLRESLLKEAIMFGTDRSQENIKPFTDMTLPGSKTPVDYFKIDINLAERDYCFERSSCGASKLVTRRGERHYVNREPCPSCFQGRDNFCVYEFIRQAKLAGITLLKNPKQLKLLFFKYVQALNTKD